jgi:soluble lytic murein transglycosylase-like protein
MMYLLFMMLQVDLFAQNIDCTGQHNVKCLILEHNPRYANAIEAALDKYSKKYNIDKELVAAILAQESKFKLDAISHTEDYGISQINIKTIHNFKFNKDRLLRDPDYAIHASFIVLSDFKRMYGRKDHEWFTRYNASKPSKRKRYKKKVYVYKNKLKNSFPCIVKL